MNTRAAAAAILAEVIGEGKSLSPLLQTALPRLRSDPDRAFVQNLCFGTLRWYWRLDRALATLLVKPIKDVEVRALALVGLYQLHYTRVKTHAAVAETVAAAGRKTWAKPLLNAVLRNAVRQRDRLSAQVASDPVAESAHPAWLLDALRSDWPEQWRGLIEANNASPPLTLRVNCRQTTAEDYLQRLAAAGLAGYPVGGAPFAITLETPVAVERLPGFADGMVSVQDAAAQRAIPLLSLRPGDRGLEIGAAPGGKTLHALESQPALREWVAIDIDPERNRRISENLTRAGLAATVLTADATRPETWWDGESFDRILVDAPCSATGVIRRHPDIKLLRKAGDIPRLAAMQRRILDAVWPLLAPGGRLVYATCSVLRQENEAVIDGFLQHHSDAEASMPEVDWGVRAGPGRQILTGATDMDGFYYACLERRPS